MKNLTDYIVSLEVIRETEKAILVRTENEDCTGTIEVWLPKSQIKEVTLTVTIPGTQDENGTNETKEKAGYFCPTWLINAKSIGFHFNVIKAV